MSSCFIMICFVILITIYSIGAFDLLCPTQSHRRFRANHVCQNTSLSDYTCLFEIHKKTNIESCNDDADFVLRGEQYVISGGRLSSSCPSNRYQPFLFWSNVQSQCYFQKSPCNEIAQHIYSQISPEDDSSCRCDYTQGYGFVSKPKNPCYCIPSQEDCSCYKVQCPKNTVLSMDYICRINHINAYRDECKAIVLRKDNSSTEETSIKYADQKVDTSKQPVWIIVIICIVAIGISIVFGSFICIVTLCEEVVLETTTSHVEEIVLETAVICVKEIVLESVVDETLLEPDVEKIALEKAKKLFRNKVISNWRKIKDNLDLSRMRDFLEHNGIDQATSNQLAKVRRDAQRSLVLLVFMEIQSDNLDIKLQNMCKENTINIYTLDIRPKRWPRRDYETCLNRISSEKESLKKIKLKEFLDVCLESFICSLDDYKDVIWEDRKMSENEIKDLIISYIQLLVNEGSFECLLDFVKDQSEIFANLNENLPPAIFVNPTSQPMSSMTSETKLLKDKSIQLQMQIPNCETDIQLVFQDRIKYCSKWFIKEFGIYPDHTTVRDNSLECVPLIDDVPNRLIKSTCAGDLFRVMEIYFCGKDVVHRLPVDMDIHISMMVVKSDRPNVNSTVEAPKYDIAMFLSDQRKFLIEELQPPVFIDALPEFCKILFKDIDVVKEDREKSAAQILDILNENIKKLSNHLLEIFSKKEDFFTIQERFLNIKNAYLNSSNVVANICDEFVNLITRKLDLNAIRDTITAKNDDRHSNCEIGNSVDDEEHVKIEFLVRIVLAGNKAIGAFVYALYIVGEDHLADTLSKSRERENSGNDKIEYLDSTDVLLQARFNISLASNVSQHISWPEETQC